MKQLKTIFSYIFSSKTIIVVFASYNFISLWFASNVYIIGIACAACPWYFDWSYINEPSVLLFAATFLLINRMWSYVTSVALSGFIIVKGFCLISHFGWTDWINSLSRQWQTRYELETEILKIYEIQLILAIIIFGTAVFYMIHKTTCKNTLR